MELERSLGRRLSLKGAVLVALVSLVIGLGISGSLDWLSPSRAVNFLGDAGNQRSRDPSGGLPDFVSWRKKCRPLVVNISTTQVSEGRGAARSSAVRLAAKTIRSMIFGGVFSAGRRRADRSASEVWVRDLSSMATVRS